MVFFVKDLQEVVLFALVNQHVDVVAAYCEGDHLGLVGLADIVSYYYDVGAVPIVPVVMAVEPESRPVDDGRRQWVPIYWAHVYHMVMVRVVEVRCGVDGAHGWWRSATRTACT